MSQWPNWHNPYFDPFDQSYVTGWTKPAPVIRSIGEKMTDKEAAVQAAVKSGAVQAWLCGQAIQWRVAANTKGLWNDFDPGGTPDFTVLTTDWRPSPIKAPEIRWFSITDSEPQYGQRCLISDGEVVILDRWDGADYKKSSSKQFSYWSPVPKPAQVKK